MQYRIDASDERPENLTPIVVAYLVRLQARSISREDLALSSRRVAPK